MIIAENVNPQKLNDELIQSNLKPVTIDNDRKKGEYIASHAWLKFNEDTDMDLVQQVIDIHDPTPLPKNPNQNDYLLDLDYRISKIELGV